MCLAGRAAALAVTLAATALNANAEDGDIAAGHAFAREACKVCHMVEAEEGSSRMIVIGPAFPTLRTPQG
jgi:cytochrome c2